MKVFILVAVASLAAFGVVNSAAAYSFSPPGTKIRLTGTVAISGPQGSGQCAMIWIGRTGVNGKSKAQITRAGYSGMVPPCATSASGLPWLLTPTGLHQATVANFGVIGGIQGIGPCGPKTIHITVSTGGAWRLDATLPGGCKINGSLSSNPPITIAP